MSRPGARRVLLALGSNLGDRVGYLRAAVAAMPDVEALSSVWETEPVGGPEGQGAYLNMVVELRTSYAPRELLALCRRLEAAAGRERSVYWGPRTLDCDIIWVDGEAVDEPDLHVPHPRYRERAFVLAPLEELAPDLVPPGWRHEPAGEVVNVGPLGAL